ncbi:hypothetical protein [Halobacillus sp. Marseille-Q1614]|uniref:hypothetical protein n=1 Tax=Halobacillus sp. Marseille-Q1614 TaxID=2709134 RepID=UPI00156F1145|nr:hypothetical protein [Halobacillus sp. Marseille-Q1614]
MAQVMAGLNDIRRAKDDIEVLKRNYDDIYEQLTHVVSLTRQMQLKYGYMGALLMDNELPEFKPKFVRDSILTLYQKEVQKLKGHQDIAQVKALLQRNSKVGEPKIFLLILGAKPELIQGSTFIK